VAALTRKVEDIVLSLDGTQRGGFVADIGNDDLDARYAVEVEVVGALAGRAVVDDRDVRSEPGDSASAESPTSA